MLCCLGLENFNLNNSLWDWESGLQRKGCCLLMGRSTVLCRVGVLLSKQLLMGLKDWTSEGNMLYSTGMECCVVLSWRGLIYTTPYMIGRVDFSGQGVV